MWTPQDLKYVWPFYNMHERDKWFQDMLIAHFVWQLCRSNSILVSHVDVYWTYRFLQICLWKPSNLAWWWLNVRNYLMSDALGSKFVSLEKKIFWIIRQLLHLVFTWNMNGKKLPNGIKRAMKRYQNTSRGGTKFGPL